MPFVAKNYVNGKDKQPFLNEDSATELRTK